MAKVEKLDKLTRNPDKLEYPVTLSAPAVEGMWYLCKASKLRHISERKKAGKLVRALKACGAMVPAAENDEFNYRFKGGTCPLTEQLVKFLEELEERLHKSQDGFASQYAESVDVMWDAIEPVRDRAKFEKKQEGVDLSEMEKEEEEAGKDPSDALKMEKDK